MMQKKIIFYSLFVLFLSIGFNQSNQSLLKEIDNIRVAYSNYQFDGKYDLDYLDKLLENFRLDNNLLGATQVLKLQIFNINHSVSKVEKNNFLISWRKKYKKQKFNASKAKLYNNEIFYESLMLLIDSEKNGYQRIEKDIDRLIEKHLDKNRLIDKHFTLFLYFMKYEQNKNQSNIDILSNFFSKNYELKNSFYYLDFIKNYFKPELKLSNLVATIDEMRIKNNYYEALNSEDRSQRFDKIYFSTELNTLYKASYYKNNKDTQNKALIIFEDLLSRGFKSNQSLYDMSILYIELNKPEKAINLFKEESINYIEKNNSNQFQNISSEMYKTLQTIALSKAYQSINQTDSALFFAKKAAKQTKSLLSDLNQPNNKNIIRDFFSACDYGIEIYNLLDEDNYFTNQTNIDVLFKEAEKISKKINLNHTLNELTLFYFKNKMIENHEDISFESWKISYTESKNYKKDFYVNYYKALKETFESGNYNLFFNNLFLMFDSKLDERYLPIEEATLLLEDQDFMNKVSDLLGYSWTKENIISIQKNFKNLQIKFIWLMLRDFYLYNPNYSFDFDSDEPAYNFQNINKKSENYNLISKQNKYMGEVIFYNSIIQKSLRDTHEEWEEGTFFYLSHIQEKNTVEYFYFLNAYTNTYLSYHIHHRTSHINGKWKEKDENWGVDGNYDLNQIHKTHIDSLFYEFESISQKFKEQNNSIDFIKSSIILSDTKEYYYSNEQYDIETDFESIINLLEAVLEEAENINNYQLQLDINLRLAYYYILISQTQNDINTGGNFYKRAIKIAKNHNLIPSSQTSHLHNKFDVFPYGTLDYIEEQDSEYYWKIINCRTWEVLSSLNLLPAFNNYIKYYDESRYYGSSANEIKELLELADAIIEQKDYLFEFILETIELTTIELKFSELTKYNTNYTDKQKIDISKLLIDDIFNTFKVLEDKVKKSEYGESQQYTDAIVNAVRVAKDILSFINSKDENIEEYLLRLDPYEEKINMAYSVSYFFNLIEGRNNQIQSEKLYKKYYKILLSYKDYFEYWNLEVIDYLSEEIY